MPRTVSCVASNTRSPAFKWTAAWASGMPDCECTLSMSDMFASTGRRSVERNDGRSPGLRHTTSTSPASVPSVRASRPSARSGSRSILAVIGALRVVLLFRAIGMPASFWGCSGFWQEESQPDKGFKSPGHHGSLVAVNREAPPRTTDERNERAVTTISDLAADLGSTRRVQRSPPPDQGVARLPVGAAEEFRACDSRSARRAGLDSGTRYAPFGLSAPTAQKRTRARCGRPGR